MIQGLLDFSFLCVSIDFHPRFMYYTIMCSCNVIAIVIIICLHRFTIIFGEIFSRDGQSSGNRHAPTSGNTTRHSVCCVVFIILCETSGGLASGYNNNNNSIVGIYTGFIYFASGITNTVQGTIYCFYIVLFDCRQTCGRSRRKTLVTSLVWISNSPLASAGR